jgi:predicted DCC family thiol-disulfide oxidoreductase YuxK
LQTKSNQEYHSILFYDAYCVLCNRLVQFILKFDKIGKIKFAPIQGKTHLDYFTENDSIFQLDSVILKTSNKVLIKSSAFFEVLSIIGGPIKILLILQILPLKLNDFFYDMISKNRYKVFGKYDSCPIIPKKIINRFLP